MLDGRPWSGFRKLARRPVGFRRWRAFHKPCFSFSCVFFLQFSVRLSFYLRLFYSIIFIIYFKLFPAIGTIKARLSMEMVFRSPQRPICTRNITQNHWIEWISCKNIQYPRHGPDSQYKFIKFEISDSPVKLTSITWYTLRFACLYIRRSSVMVGLWSEKFQLRSLFRTGLIGFSFPFGDLGSSGCSRLSVTAVLDAPWLAEPLRFLESWLAEPLRLLESWLAQKLWCHNLSLKLVFASM